jgi:cytochrome b6-f complex iron-sulfur subunit
MRALSRREFHALAAAGAALALLPGCPGPFDGSVTPVEGLAVLTFAQFPGLRAAGGSAIVDVRGSFPIVAIRTSDTEAVALSATCTHAGCILRFAPAHDDVHCDCHDANFALSGAVESGPTLVPLPVYAATVEADAISVAIG